jgi:hypothetical protein
MLGIVLIIFIGNYFYKLAHEFNKNRWLFAILGIASYYAGTAIAGFTLGIITAMNGSDFVNTTPRFVLSIIFMPFGLLTCWGFYRILFNQWNKQSMINNNDSLDANLMN